MSKSKQNENETELKNFQRNQRLLTFKMKHFGTEFWKFSS